MKTAKEVIQKLDLKPLPEEGGYYRETYRSEKIDAPARLLGIDTDEPRVMSTAIYYLIIPESFSALHRIKSEEIFHFYAGDPVEMIQINKQGVLSRCVLGADIFKGEVPQVVVPRGDWQALRLPKGSAWSLMGTTVSPGFEFADFEVGDREQLLKDFPAHREEIMRFTRAVGEKTHV